MKSLYSHTSRVVATHCDAILAGFVIGLAMALAYLVPYCGALLPVFLAALVYVFRKRSWSKRQALVGGFVFAMTYEFLILSWAWRASFFLSSLPIHVPFVLAGLLIFFTLVLISGVAGVTFLPWAYLTWRYRFSFIFDTLLLAGVWVVSEWIRVAALSILSFGDGVLNPPYLSFGMIGYALADYPRVVSLAAYGGIFTLSLLLAILGVLGFHWYEARHRKASMRPIYGALAMVLLLSGELIALHGSHVPPSRYISVTVASTYTSLPAMPNYDENISVAQKGRALVVLPEGSRQFYLFAKTNPESLYPGSVVIDSYPVLALSQKGKTTPGAFAVTATSTTLVREKHALAPYGEFTPFAMTVLAHLAGFAKTLDQFTLQRHYTQGSYDGSFAYDGARGSVIFCDEIAVPNIVKNIVAKTNANFMIAVASTHWFPEGHMLHRETVRMAKVRAVEAGVPLARSAYGDPGFVVDASGTMLYEGPWNQSVVATVQVPVAAP